MYCHRIVVRLYMVSVISLLSTYVELSGYSKWEVEVIQMSTTALKRRADIITVKPSVKVKKDRTLWRKLSKMFSWDTDSLFESKDWPFLWTKK